MSENQQPQQHLSQEQQGQLKQKFLSEVEGISDLDVQYASQKGQEKLSKIDEKEKNAFESVWDDVKLMVSMLNDYSQGRYKDVPWKTIAAITVAILYFASPIDFIPDFIPVIGYADDIFIIVIALEYIRDDVDAYREWRGLETH